MYERSDVQEGVALAAGKGFGKLRSCQNRPDILLTVEQGYSA